MTKVNKSLIVILAVVVALFLCLGLFAPILSASAVGNEQQDWSYTVVSGDNPFVVTSKLSFSPYLMTTLVRDNSHQNLDGFWFKCTVGDVFSTDDVPLSPVQFVRSAGDLHITTFTYNYTATVNGKPYGCKFSFEFRTVESTPDKETFSLYSYSFEPIEGYYPVMFYSVDIEVANYTLSMDMYSDLVVRFLTPAGNEAATSADVRSVLVGSNLNDYVPELPDYSQSDFSFNSWRYLVDGVYYDLTPSSVMPSSASRVVIEAFYAYSVGFLAGNQQLWEQTGYDRGFTAGYDNGHNVGFEDGKEYQNTQVVLGSESYKAGFSTGFADGEEVGYEDGYSVGHNEGTLAGYNQGHDVGFEDGKKYQDTQVVKTSASWFAGVSQGRADGGEYSFLGLFSAILDAPVRALFGYTAVENGVTVEYPGLFSFEVFGVDLSTLYLSLFSACIVFCLLRLVL